MAKGKKRKNVKVKEGPRKAPLGKLRLAPPLIYTMAFVLFGAIVALQLSELGGAAKVMAGGSPLLLLGLLLFVVGLFRNAGTSATSQDNPLGPQRGAVAVAALLPLLLGMGDILYRGITAMNRAPSIEPSGLIDFTFTSLVSSFTALTMVLLASALSSAALVLVGWIHVRSLPLKAIKDDDWGVARAIKVTLPICLLLVTITVLSGPVQAGWGLADVGPVFPLLLLTGLLIKVQVDIAARDTAGGRWTAAHLTGLAALGALAVVMLAQALLFRERSFIVAYLEHGLDPRPYQRRGMLLVNAAMGCSVVSALGALGVLLTRMNLAFASLRKRPWLLLGPVGWFASALLLLASLFILTRQIEEAGLRLQPSRQGLALPVATGRMASPRGMEIHRLPEAFRVAAQCPGAAEPSLVEDGPGLEDRLGKALTAAREACPDISADLKVAADSTLSWSRLAPALVVAHGLGMTNVSLLAMPRRTEEDLTVAEYQIRIMGFDMAKLLSDLRALPVSLTREPPEGGVQVMALSDGQATLDGVAVGLGPELGKALARRTDKLYVIPGDREVMSSLVRVLEEAGKLERAVVVGLPEEPSGSP